MKAHCTKCDGTRNHTQLIQRRTRQDDVEGEQRFQRDQLLVCDGCGEVQLLRTVTGKLGDVKRTLDVSQYPPAKPRLGPPWLTTISDPETVALMQEVYSAIGLGLNRLAVMGVRAALEHTMIARVGDQGSFAKNMDEFFQRGLLTTAQRTVFEALLDVGSAAIHRAHEPTREDVDSVVSTVESMLELIYIQPLRADSLRLTTPPRPARTTSARKADD